MNTRSPSPLRTLQRSFPSAKMKPAARRNLVLKLIRHRLARNPDPPRNA